MQSDSISRFRTRHKIFRLEALILVVWVFLVLETSGWKVSRHLGIAEANYSTLNNINYMHLRKEGLRR
jgi:hypothetical protein